MITNNDTTQPVHRAAERSRTRVKEWVTTLSGPPEDVINSNLIIIIKTAIIISRGMQRPK